MQFFKNFFGLGTHKQNDDHSHKGPDEIPAGGLDKTKSVVEEAVVAESDDEPSANDAASDADVADDAGEPALPIEKRVSSRLNVEDESFIKSYSEEPVSPGDLSADMKSPAKVDKREASAPAPGSPEYKFSDLRIEGSSVEINYPEMSEADLVLWDFIQAEEDQWQRKAKRVQKQHKIHQEWLNENRKVADNNLSKKDGAEAIRNVFDKVKGFLGVDKDDFLAIKPDEVVESGSEEAVENECKNMTAKPSAKECAKKQDMEQPGWDNPLRTTWINNMDDN